MPRFTNVFSTLLLGSCALAYVAGCAVRPTYEGRSDPYGPRQIEFTSEELQNDTAVSEPHLTRDPSGYLHIQVPIRSAIDKDLHVDYQTQFFDSSGGVIETTEWHTVTLPANTPETVSDVCTSPAAANFQTTFRYAR
jgi:uncharacterized protein DUF1425